MKVVLLRFLETLGNRAPARRREDRRERAFRDADEASLDDPAQPPSMAAQQRAPISLLNQDGQRVGLLHARGGGQRAARRGARGGRWTAADARPTRRGPKWRQGARGRQTPRDRQDAGRSCGKARRPLPPTPCKHDSNGHGQKATVSPVFRLEGALRLRAAADVRTKLLVEGEGGFSIPKWE